jgi:hypothetical protein
MAGWQGGSKIFMPINRGRAPILFYNKTNISLSKGLKTRRYYERRKEKEGIRMN